MSRLLRVLVPLLLLAALLTSYQRLRRGRRVPLVVYCAHDSIYSETILREFERRTGIPLSIRFDTEATKSLGLVELIFHERDHPSCDVFWNNEVLGTLRLCDAGLLLPYRGTGYARIPAEFKDPAGRWVGFAARLRVYIGNAVRLPSLNDSSVSQALAGPRLDRIAIAKPLYGTTLTQYAVLWRHWGRDRLIAWHRDCQRRGIIQGAGNAAVKDLVAQGACDLGFTDTDDFFEAKDDGKPVAMLPYQLDTGETILIPNTVSIVRGTRRSFRSAALGGLSALCRGGRGIGARQIAADSARSGVRGARPAGGAGVAPVIHPARFARRPRPCSRRLPAMAQERVVGRPSPVAECNFQRRGERDPLSRTPCRTSAS